MIRKLLLGLIACIFVEVLAVLLPLTFFVQMYGTGIIKGYLMATLSCTGIYLIVPPLQKIVDGLDSFLK